MPYLPSADASVFQLHGVTFNSFVSTATGASRLASWRADFAPSTPGQAHTMTEEEVLYVVSGQLDVEVDSEQFTARAGDAVLVPAGALFRIGNSTDAPAHAWVTSLLGMRAALHPDGERITPPWAQ